MSKDEIMPICTHCSHQIIRIKNHWEHRYSSKQEIGKNSKLPEPTRHSGCCYECEKNGKKCCNPEPKEGE